MRLNNGARVGTLTELARKRVGFFLVAELSTRSAVNIDELKE